ncbi:MAG: hypothetical protein IJ629_05600 [Clostridia bacterium]|nr:hypothetical protein [Clostridia bacterium]
MNKEKKLKVIILVIVVVALIFFTIYLYKRIVHKEVNHESSTETKYVTLQVIREDIMDDSKQVVDEMKKQPGDVAFLSKKEEYKQYGKEANDITILEINDKSVKISREKIDYSYDETGMNVISHVEKVVDDIEYNQRVDISINDSYPDSSAYSQARYYYYVQFIKN